MKACASTRPGSSCPCRLEAVVVIGAAHRKGLRTAAERFTAVGFRPSGVVVGACVRCRQIPLAAASRTYARLTTPAVSAMVDVVVGRVVSRATWATCPATRIVVGHTGPDGVNFLASSPAGRFFFNRSRDGFFSDAAAGRASRKGSTAVVGLARRSCSASIGALTVAFLSGTSSVRAIYGCCSAVGARGRSRRSPAEPEPATLFGAAIGTSVGGSADRFLASVAATTCAAPANGATAAAFVGCSTGRSCPDARLKPARRRNGAGASDRGGGGCRFRFGTHLR